MDSIISLGSIIGVPSQAYTLYSPEGVSPTLSSGEKRYGGLPIWIIVDIYEGNQLCNERSE